MNVEDQVRIEGQLGRELADADRTTRRRLYGAVYDRVYEMHFAHDPGRLEFGARPAMVDFIARHLPAGKGLEVGCGTGMVATALALRGRRMLAVDVSEVALGRARERARGLPGITFQRVEGIAVPVGDGTLDFAYSIEVLEHLHEDDARAHLVEIHRVLRPGGCYWLLTPNRLDPTTAAQRHGAGHANGDIDRSSPEGVRGRAGGSSGMHLKEWTYAELNAALRDAGFRKLRSPWRNERLLWLPLLPARTFAFAERTPLAASRMGRSLGGVIACSIIAVK